MKPKLLVATDISNIAGLGARLRDVFDVLYIEKFSAEDAAGCAPDIEAIFTNPNNSKVYYGREILHRFRSLRYLVTASTGTIHIDKEYCGSADVKVISITKSINVLERITSTAELAFLLTLSTLRYYDLSRKSVDEMRWDYSPFIGRQVNSLTIGVLGFGRLGKMYAHYCKSFGARTLVCDPFEGDAVRAAGYEQVNIHALFEQSDVVSVHVHADKENIGLIDSRLLQCVRTPFILVNTSRGEIVDEPSIIQFAHSHPNFYYAADVIKDEHLGLSDNLLRKSELYGRQIVLTPHCGGMTHDARAIAYTHAAELLLEYYRS